MRKTFAQLLVLVPLSLFWRWPLKLLDNAVLGWADEQIAKMFNIPNPTLTEVLNAAWQWGVPLIGAACTLWVYHIWHAWHTTMISPIDSARRADRSTAGQLAMNESTPNSQVYFTAYEAVHYLADNSQWGLNKVGEITPDGMRKNVLLEAPIEFKKKAQEGKITVYGRRNGAGEHELIDKSHWMSAIFDWETTYRPDAPGRTAPAGPNADGIAIYTDLKIVAEDVFQAWPRRDQKIPILDAAREAYQRTQGKFATHFLWAAADTDKKTEVEMLDYLVGHLAKVAPHLYGNPSMMEKPEEICQTTFRSDNVEFRAGVLYNVHGSLARYTDIYITRTDLETAIATLNENEL